MQKWTKMLQLHATRDIHHILSHKYTKKKRIMNAITKNEKDDDLKWGLERYIYYCMLKTGAKWNKVKAYLWLMYIPTNIQIIYCW